MGVCIARDLASAGYTCAIVERGDSLGGVWYHNNYPGLSLQGLGNAWRCLSLAPKWHSSHPAAEMYAPTAKDILGYILDMASHARIDVFTSSVCETESEESKPAKHIVRISTGGGAPRTVLTKAICLATGYDTQRSGKPHLPIDPSEVRNGATIVHSARYHANMPMARGRTFVLGAHNAAIEILKELIRRRVSCGHIVATLSSPTSKRWSRWRRRRSHGSSTR
ncbi:unnamed protein product [Polarella glacialis]|uniref:L-ornithine N(5)-monooxygenase [NAD(P)H] n=1 Tax=Polarella glacialis TaxID=89957 RepID=A0A813H8D5_POLGL|nr:unnamed protein product [Polarella glacialis]